MLYEIKNVRQRRGEGIRRWFSDDYWDLFTWTDDESGIVRFQLSYGKPDAESCLVWKKNTGFSHHRVNPGEPHSGVHRTPILVQGGSFQAADVMARFKQDSVQIDGDIARLVLQKLSEYRT